MSRVLVLTLAVLALTGGAAAAGEWVNAKAGELRTPTERGRRGGWATVGALWLALAARIDARHCLVS